VTRSMPIKIAGISVLLILGTLIHAHEIGTTRVTAAFKEDRTYEIEIATDAVALADKLLASKGAPPLSAPRADDLLPLLEGFDEAFRQRVKVVFDASEVRPAVRYAITPASGPASVPGAAIKLTGRIPSGASRFSWTYAWTFASYALTIQNAPNTSAATQWLEGDQTSASVVLAAPPPPINRLATAWRYLTLGFTHIVPYGLDHMLFVLGIYLLSRRARSVLLQVSAFTVAHSITLGLSMYGFLSVPSRVVEPMIAISIAYVAIENIFHSELKSWRVALVFVFGLLHGLGFAGALKELRMPRSEFLTALLTFNVGVETGQLAVISAAFLLFGWHCSHRAWYRSRVVVPLSMLIACTALFWTFQRLS
jgi:hydrogenase/urease accessory protein HupE